MQILLNPYPCLLTFILPCLALFASCNDGKEDKGKPGVGQSVPGKNWSGYLYATDESDRTVVKAVISQEGKEGEAVVTFETSGKMLVTDAFDGEWWSTFFGPAHGNYIKLADYETRPVPGNGKDDFYILELSRNGGSRPADVVYTAPGTTRDPDPDPTHAGGSTENKDSTR